MIFHLAIRRYTGRPCHTRAGQAETGMDIAGNRARWHCHGQQIGVRRKIDTSCYALSTVGKVPVAIEISLGIEHASSTGGNGNVSVVTGNPGLNEDHSVLIIPTRTYTRHRRAHGSIIAIVAGSWRTIMLAVDTRPQVQRGGCIESMHGAVGGQQRTVAVRQIPEIRAHHGYRIVFHLAVRRCPIRRGNTG